MSPIQTCIKTKSTNINPIWLMRQAGRYLPEFRDIRLKNPDFIKLCLNKNLSSEITIQPLKRFAFDAAIIFSDILMLPYGLGQDVSFKKNFGPQLGEINLNDMLKKKACLKVDSVEELENNLRELLKNEDKMRNMKINSFKFSQKKFFDIKSLDKHINKYLDLC